MSDGITQHNIKQEARCHSSNKALAFEKPPATAGQKPTANDPAKGQDDKDQRVENTSGSIPVHDASVELQDT